LKEKKGGAPMPKGKKEKTKQKSIRQDWKVIKDLNRSLKEKLPEFQRTETINLPKVLPPAEELQDLKVLIEWYLKLWAEHDGFIFKPGFYFNE
jgi:hypothetical protein